MNMEKLTAQLRVFALDAITWVERKGRETLLREGRKLVGEDKEKLAVEYAVTLYRAASAGTPLAAVTFDDELVRQAMRQAVRLMWEKVGELVNEVGEAPVLDAAEFQSGRVE